MSLFQFENCPSPLTSQSLMHSTLFAPIRLALPIAVILVAALPSLLASAQTSDDFPASDPIITPEKLDQDWNQQLKQRLNKALSRETIARSEAEHFIEQTVDRAVHRNFSWTIGLLNALLLLLITMPIVGLILLWLLRRSLIAQIVEEVEQRIGAGPQAGLSADSQRDRLNDASPVSASMDRPSTPPPADSSTSPGSTDEQAARLKEMVSMALSVRQTLAAAHPPLEASVEIHDQLGDRLDDRLDYHLDRAKQLGRTAQYAEALTAYDQVIEIDPQTPIPHCARGALFVRLRRFDEAIAAFDRALEVQPDCAEACYGKACCLANLGQIDHAIINLQAAIALAPGLKNVAQSDPLLAAIRGQDWFQTEVVG